MDFSLTEEQRQIKQTVREFAQAEIKPHVMEWDEAQHFPLDIMKKLGELGMLGAAKTAWSIRLSGPVRRFFTPASAPALAAVRAFRRSPIR